MHIADLGDDKTPIASNSNRIFWDDGVTRPVWLRDDAANATATAVDIPSWLLIEQPPSFLYIKWSLANVLFM